MFLVLRKLVHQRIHRTFELLLTQTKRKVAPRTSRIPLTRSGLACADRV